VVVDKEDPVEETQVCLFKFPIVNWCFPKFWLGLKKKGCLFTIPFVKWCFPKFWDNTGPDMVVLDKEDPVVETQVCLFRFPIINWCFPKFWLGLKKKGASLRSRLSSGASPSSGECHALVYMCFMLCLFCSWQNIQPSDGLSWMWLQKT